MQDLPKKIIVMYHSISSDNFPSVIGSFPITMKVFIEQIELAISLGYVVKPISSLDLEVPNNERWLFITEDDGTVDWTRNVLPWCENKGYYTHTAVITGPWLEAPLYPLAHVIQVILSSRSRDKLQKLATEIQDFLSKDQLLFIEKMYFYESFTVSKIIKGACNLIFDYKISRDFLYPLTEQEQELLINRFEIADFYQQFAYAEVGVHTRTHVALGNDLEKYLQDEILTSKQDILDVGLQVSDIFTLPMKPKFGVTSDILSTLLLKEGFKGMLVSEKGIWDGKSFAIPRIDSVNFTEFLLQIP